MTVALPVVATFCIPFEPRSPGALSHPGAAGSIRCLCDRFERGHLDGAARDAAGLGGVVLEEVALLQRLLAGVLVHRGDVKVVRAVASLHAAVADLALERRVGVDRRYEPADLAVPVLGRALGTAIADEK